METNGKSASKELSWSYVSVEAPSTC